MTLQKLLDNSKEFISRRKNELTLGALTLFTALNMNAQSSGLATYTSQGGHKVPITATISEIADETNTIEMDAVVNDGPYAFNDITLSIQDYLTNNLNGFKLFNNPGDPSIFFNGLKGKTTAQMYTINGKFVGAPQLDQVSGNIMRAYTDFPNMANGLYLIKLTNEFGTKSVKVINDNSNDAPVGLTRNIQNRLDPLSSIVNKQYSKTTNAKTTNSLNTRFSWPFSEQNEINTGETVWTLDGFKDVELLPGAGNNVLIDNVVTYDVGETGDALITAVDPNGTQLTNVNITMSSDFENYIRNLTIDNTGFVIAEDHPVLVNDTPYTFTATQPGGTVQDTQVTVNLSQGQNNNQVEIVMPFASNIVQTTFAARNIDNMNDGNNTNDMEAGQTIQIYDANDNSLIDELTTPASGIVTTGIEDGRKIYTKISKNGYYTKTNKSTTIQKNAMSQDTLNIMAIPYRTMSNGEHLPGSVVKDVLIDGKANWALMNGGEMYVLPSPNEAAMKTEITNMMVAAGYPAPTFASSPVTIPGDAEAAAFNVYTTPIDFGVNMTALTGSLTNTITSGLQANGHYVTLSANPFDAGGSPSDWRELQHELWRLLGYETDGTYPSVGTIGNITNFFDSIQNVSSAPLLPLVTTYSFQKDENNNRYDYSYIQNITD